jgi:hypothetical protein
VVQRGVPIDEIEVLRPSSELLERRGNGRYPVGYTQLGSAPSRLFTERFGQFDQGKMPRDPLLDFQPTPQAKDTAFSKTRPGALVFEQKLWCPNFGTAIVPPVQITI